MAAKKAAAVGTSANTHSGARTFSRKNFAPILYLWINGKESNDLLRLCTEFTYKRALTKSAEIHFHFRNDDHELMDDVRLFPNTEWRIRFGYFSDMSPIITAYVRQVEPSYADKRTVVITLFDAALTMAQKSSGKNWGTVTTSSIAKAIAQSYGMKAIVEDSKDKQKKAWIQPNNINDIQYLRDLAVMVDFEVFVDGSPPVLHYRAKKYDSAPRNRLIYYDDPTEYSYVKKFALKVKSLGPLASTASGAKTETNKKNEKAQAKDPNAGVYFNAAASGGKVTTVYVPPKAINIQAPADHKAGPLVEAARKQMLDKANEAHSEHPLTPSINAGSIYEWSGIEKQVDGKWYCSEENHTINGTGSSTHCTWKRNPADTKKNNKDVDKKNGGAGKGEGPAVYIEASNGKTTFQPGKEPPPPRK